MNRNRNRFTLVELGVVISIVGALSTGYAPAALAQSSQRIDNRTNSRSVITKAEIEKFDSNASVHDLVHALRRSWLNVQTTSLRETPTIIAQGKEEALVIPASKATLLVYLDNVKLGSIEELRSQSLASVVEVRYYNPAQAMRRWGSGHEHGAIEVITANAGTER